MVAPAQVTVLFQGDSITDAYRMPAERNDAYQLGAGYAMMVAATLRADHPLRNLTFVNRGVSGNTLADVQRRWEVDALTVTPRVISLLVGTNDAGNPEASPDHYARSLEELIALTGERLPDVKWIFCEPFGFESEIVDAARLQRLAEIRGALRGVARDACVVPLQSVLDHALNRAPARYWVYDGIHPTAAGHLLIARAWLEHAADVVLGAMQ